MPSSALQNGWQHEQYPLAKETDLVLKQANDDRSFHEKSLLYQDLHILSIEDRNTRYAMAYYYTYWAEA